MDTHALDGAIEKQIPTMEEEFSNLSDAFSGQTSEIDPYPLFAKMRAEAPIMEGDLLAKYGVPSQAGNSDKRKIFTLFRYDDILQVLRNQTKFTSALLGEGLGLFLDGLMLTAMDGAEHKLTRNLLQPAFAPSVVERWRKNLMHPLARESYVAKFQADKRVELISQFALPYPVHVIYQVIGFPENQEAFEQFAARGLRILIGPQRDPEKAKASFIDAMQASKELYESIRPLVEQRRAAGAEGDDLLGFLLRANYEGRQLDDHEITGFIRMLLPAAAETTTRTLGNTIICLLRNPDTMAAVRADYSLIPAVIDEALRYEPVAGFLAREVAEDTEFHGVTVPKGSALSLSTASASRDEKVFVNPEVFDINRPKRATFGFGFGPHMCIGMMIAKFEVEVALQAMLEMLPNFRLDPATEMPKIEGLNMRGPRALHLIWD